MWNRVAVNPAVKDRFQQICGVLAVRANSTSQQPPVLESVLKPVVKQNTKEEKISRAMRAYLERAASHEKFMSERRDEFNLGKRHLANIMGWNPEEISQQDVDEAIEYLLPSGLFERKARPMMKPPEEIFAKQKLTELHTSGRPNNYLFYTGRGNFYRNLHDAVSEKLKLDEHQIIMRAKGVRIAPASEKFDMKGFDLVKQDVLAETCLEPITDVNYQYFVKTMERLIEHPYSNMAKGFLLKFLRPRAVLSNEQTIQPLLHDEANNPYTTAEGRRKTARAIVRVTGNGTGKTLINGTRSVDEYFPDLQDRLQVMFPLQFVGLLNKVDVEATIYYRHDPYDVGQMAKNTPEQQKELVKPLELRQGLACEAGAIRLGLARCLCSFVTKEDVQLMRLSGLLTVDVRRREKKKGGKRGARRSYHWRKR